MTHLPSRIDLGALLGVLLLITSQTASAADPMTGKWQLRLENSMYESGPAPKSMVRTQEIEGDSIKVTDDIVEADGQTRQVRYTATIDGKDYPIEGASNANTLSVKRVDAHTLDYTLKKAGKTTLTGTIRVSEDGAELEISAKNAKDEESRDLMVFEKQQ